MNKRLYKAIFFHTMREFWRGEAGSKTEARSKARKHLKCGYKGEEIIILPVYESEA
jgi:hypothetical protein